MKNNNNIRVLQVITKYINYGGEVAIAEYEREQLKKNGFIVDQFNLDNKKLFNNKLYAIYVLFNLGRNQYTKNTLKKKLASFKPHIVHIYSYFPQFPLSLLKVISKNKVKIVMTLSNYRLVCSNGYLFTNQNLCFDCLKKKKYSPILKKCYRSSFLLSFLASRDIFNNWEKNIVNKYVDKFFCMHEFSKNIHTQYGIDNKKITIKNNPIANNFIKKINYYSKKNFGLFIGRNSPEKGIEFLINAWTGIQYQLILLGDIKNNLISQNHYILNAGFMNDKKKYEYFMEANFLVFPSLWHEAGTPLVILEALASGLPVICANIQPMNDIIRHNYNGLLYEYNDIEDLKSKIKILISNNKLQNQLSKNATKSYRERFSNMHSEEILINEYESLII